MVVSAVLRSPPPPVPGSCGRRSHGDEAHSVTAELRHVVDVRGEHDVRPPLTRFVDLGEEGRAKVEKLEGIMRELDELIGELDGAGALVA